MALVAPSIVVVPLWARAANRFGKAPCLLVATAGYAVVTASLLLTASAERIWLVVAQVALLGCGYAALQLLAFSLLPDTISDDETRSGRRQAGAFTGVWTAGETLGAAAGPALYAAVLALSSFVSSPADERVAQPESAVTGVLVGSRWCRWCCWRCPCHCWPGSRGPARRCRHERARELAARAGIDEGRPSGDCA